MRRIARNCIFPHPAQSLKTLAAQAGSMAKLVNAADLKSVFYLYTPAEHPPTLEDRQ
jgi:hypothetical protein